MRLLIRVPGIDIVHEISVLDDTGSTYLELFQDDCWSMGFQPNRIPRSVFGYRDALITVNGMIWVDKVLMQVQFITTDRSTHYGESNYHQSTFRYPSKMLWPGA